MATFTTHPPVGHGHRDMPSAVAHRAGNTKARAVAGVRLEATGIGYAAQGWRFEQVETTPAYWMAGRVDSDERETAGTLTMLVRRLVADGHLVEDAGER